VDAAIRDQLESGITFSLMHPLEVEVAERLRDLVPCAESVRFSKSGADVTSAAVRLARAFTGRDRVLCCGYHGWHDWYIAVTDRHRGIPEASRDLSFTFDYNDPDAFDAAIDDSIACVILEPVVFEEPRAGFLAHVRRRCTELGIVLVFDEMWTGFRMAAGGAQAHYGVTPDLATFSKAVANGMPLAVLAGRADIMALLEREVFWFTTFGGEALSLAAARATLRELEAHEVPGHLAALGARLRDGYNRIAEALDINGWTACAGPSCRTIVTFAPPGQNALAVKSFVQQELIRRGVLWSGTHSLSFSHTDEDIEYLLNAYHEVLAMARDAVHAGTVERLLRGKPVEPVFRKTSRFNLKPRA
jgi:glutamate-1-semialdehyde aminotransferase